MVVHEPPNAKAKGRGGFLARPVERFVMQSLDHHIKSYPQLNDGHKQYRCEDTF